MYQASVPAAQSKILASHNPLKFQESALIYSLAQSPTGTTYTVSDGVSSHSAEALWAFGAGAIGQTYLLKNGDAYIEGRVSYYTSLAALDITIGHSPQTPASVEAALGHTMDQQAARRCFSCHTTGAVASNRFEPEKAVPGVQCEACHGPGAAHVASMSSQRGEHASATIMNPARLTPADSVDFCGACHRTWADVVEDSSPGAGIVKVRFQPYRLENSRCWGKDGDPRITCIACHDPHLPLVREAAAYDSKCLACHSAGQKGRADAKTGTTCKVATGNCVSCHMPRYSVPQTHAIFTDHYIRVVRPTTQRSARQPLANSDRNSDGD
jgi:hypothetical protein